MKECQGFQEINGIVSDSEYISNFDDINYIKNEKHQEFDIIFIA